MRIVTLAAHAFGLVVGAAVVGDDGSARAFNSEGIEHYEARRYHQAIESFKKALALDPDSPDVRSNLAGAWSGLGVEFLNSGETASAVRAFEESLAVHEDFYAHFGLGYVRFMDQEDDAARRHLASSLELRPDFARTHKLIALVDYREGDEEAALAGMEKASAMDPEDREAAAILKRWRTEARVLRRFRTRESKHFEVRHDPLIAPELVEAVHSHLEAALATGAEQLGRRRGKRLVVGLFRERSFHEATGTHHWIGGLFDGQIKISVPAVAPRGSGGSDPDGPEGDLDGATAPGGELENGALGEVFRAVRHELTHALVKDLYPACPNWLNEGIAQLFELFPVPAIDGKGAGLTERQAAGLRFERSRRLREDLRRRAGRRIPFARIPSRLWEVADEAEARWTYVQGLGFIEHLAQKYGIFRIRLLLETARDEGSLSRAFELTYGRTLEELETAWWQSALE